MIYDLIHTRVNNKVRYYDLYCDQVLMVNDIPYVEAQNVLSACIKPEDVFVTTIDTNLQYADSGKEFLQSLNRLKSHQEKSGLVIGN